MKDGGGRAKYYHVCMGVEFRSCAGFVDRFFIRVAGGGSEDDG